MSEAAQLTRPPLHAQQAETGMAPFLIFGPDRNETARNAARAAGGRYTQITDIGEALNALERTRGGAHVLVIDSVDSDAVNIAGAFRKASPGLVTVSLAAPDAAADPEVQKASFVALPAPVDPVILRTILAAALNEAERRAQANENRIRLLDVFRCAETAKFTFRTIEEADRLAHLLSFAFTEPAKAEQDLAALMHNAIEHGNLEIGFKEKSRLLEDGAFETEIIRRLDDPVFVARRAETILARKPEGVYAVIKDEGAGFDWREFVKFSPARAAHRNGRGIQLARLACFDKLAFNEPGNQVSAFCAVPEDGGDPL